MTLAWACNGFVLRPLERSAFFSGFFRAVCAIIANMTSDTTILLITPPMTQTNAPYPAAPALAGFLRRNGVAAAQFDMSISVANRVVSREGVRRVRKAAESQPALRRLPELGVFFECADEYENLADDARAFLSGAKPELAFVMARRGFFPEGPAFRELDPSGEGLGDENLAASFGDVGIADRAKHLASLFLDDIAFFVRLAIDPLFGFAKYAEHLAASAPDFSPLYERLSSPAQTWIDELIDEFARRECERLRPAIVGVTAPFPGTVYGAFKVAERVRRRFPHIRTVLGGGYVNSELREMNDPRVAEFFDHVSYDEGFEPLLKMARAQDAARKGLGTRGWKQPAKEPPPPRDAPQISPPVIHSACAALPDCSDIGFAQYFSMLETANPAHRLWSDGRWLKVQLARGCYWRKCAFCDTTLPYIRGFSMPDPARAVDELVALKRGAGISAFHFTDEALPPALVSKLCDQLLARRETIAWWGNIRFDEAFDDALAAKMSRAGCVAATAGLECANDRLLALMNKGVTLAGARRVCAALSRNGILAHAYLMYGFPTQTLRETAAALDFVRKLYADGLLHSTYWHRFALTTHSELARNPAKFGIKLRGAPSPDDATARRFALNEIEYDELAPAPDWIAVGAALRAANYNFMRGAGLDIPAREWLGPASGIRR